MSFIKNAIKLLIKFKEKEEMPYWPPCDIANILKLVESGWQERMLLSAKVLGFSICHLLQQDDATYKLTVVTSRGFLYGMSTLGYKNLYDVLKKRNTTYKILSYDANFNEIGHLLIISGKDKNEIFSNLYSFLTHGHPIVIDRLMDMSK